VTPVVAAGFTVTLPVVGFDIPSDVVVVGIITGLTYALLGMGLTLVYKTSRVINFAQGEMGAFPALFIPILVLNHGWNYWLTLVLALVSSVVIGALVEFLVIRRLRTASRLTALVATIGIAQVLYVFGLLLPKEGSGGSQLAGKDYPTPFDWHLTIGDLVLGPGELLILVVVPAVTIGLTVFLRRSRMGKASRAAAENADAAALAGIPINRVSLAMWAIAGLLAGLAAILVGPTRPINLSNALGPSLMVRALGAAMLGGLASLPGVFVGGVAIGVIEAIILWNYPRGGLLEVVIFGIIVGSLLLKRGLGQMARGSEQSTWALAATLRPLPHDLAVHRRVRASRALLLTLVLVVAVALPLPLDTSQAFFLANVVVFALMALSLVVLTGMAGQISLGQLAFVGIGAAVGGRAYQLGFPHIVGIVAAIAVGAVVALVVGLPALRIRGLFLAVTTLAFAVAVSAWAFSQGWLNHRDNGQPSLQIPRPLLFGWDFEAERYYYWLCLAGLVLAAVFVHQLRKSNLGRSMVAVRDNEPSAASLAISPRRIKLLAFMISGGIASFAGFLYGGLLVNFSRDPGSTFSAQGSLDIVVMAVLGGVTTITGAVLGALWVQGIPSLFGDNFGILSSGFGVLAVLLVLPGGLASVVFMVRDRAAHWLVHGRRPAVTTPELPTVPTRAFATAAERAPTTVPPSGAPLRAEHIDVRYGGLQALADVSVRADAGEIVGLMGPNGAGKTTLFDTLSGRQRPAHGTVHLHGDDITGLPSYARARLGLGRTFQQARLFDDLTLLEVMRLALHQSTATTAAGSRRRREATALEIIDLLGLGPCTHRYVSELSTGTRRQAELACVAALGSSVLLLDEPTAGFAPSEVEHFVEALRALRSHLGATVVVIDHDVPMMVELADRLYVLEAGVVIAEGPPSIVHTDARVMAAYVGNGQRAVGATDSVH
jgi:ABC-type branched-subunit amino acid transport system permease subunit/ABC-type branched-subunit amino acid transport system ATPase component